MGNRPDIAEIKNLPQAFLEAAKKFGGRTLYNYQEDNKTPRSITYRVFIEKAGNVAVFLAGLGVAPGERVAVLAPSNIRWLLAFSGIILSGAIAVPVNETLAEEEIAAILKDARPKAVFFGKETVHLSRLAEGAAPINIDSGDFRDVLEEKGGKKKFAPHTEAPPDAPAVILYTSGTTGLPKGVVLSHENLLSDVGAIIRAEIIEENENLLAALPFYHAYPLMGNFLAPFCAGATVTLVPFIKELAAYARGYKATIIIAVPQMLELMNNALAGRIPSALRPVHRLCGVLRKRLGVNAGKVIFRKAHEALGGRIRLLASGGARLAPEVMRSLEAFGFNVVEGYGLSETSPVVTFNPVAKRKPGSAGKPLDTAEVRIEDGEVLLRGPMVTSGYWQKPEETAKVLKDGWFHTGDTGYLDKDGYLFITGRKKELIVLSSGKNIQPDVVETHYGQSPLIKEIAVYEERGSLKGVIVPDFDYARENKIANIKESFGWELKTLSQKLPPPMRLTGFAVVSEPLPRTSLGKIKRYRLREIAARAAAPAGGPDAALMKDPVGRKAVSALKTVLGRDVPVRLPDNLELDLGLDSLRRIELLNALEDEFRTEGKLFSEDFLLDVLTVGELVEKLRSAAPAQSEKGKLGKKPAPMPSRAVELPVLYALKALLKVLFRLSSTGLENIPRGPFILAPNHASFVDGFVVAGALPPAFFRRIHFQGFEKFFRGPAAHLISLFHVIPIDSGALLGGALRASAEALRRGDCLCVFPEGGRSYDGRLMELKKGITIMAFDEKVPIVPCWLEGTHRALPKGGWLLRPVKIEVRFGKPVYPADFGTPEEMLQTLREDIIGLSRRAGQS